jgi:hypothetical protein
MASHVPCHAKSAMLYGSGALPFIPSASLTNNSLGRGTNATTHAQADKLVPATKCYWTWQQRQPWTWNL